MCMATTPEGIPSAEMDGVEALADLEKTFSVEMNGIEGGRVPVPVTTSLLGVDLQMVINSQVWVLVSSLDRLLSACLYSSPSVCLRLPVSM